MPTALSLPAHVSQQLQTARALTRSTTDRNAVSWPTTVDALDTLLHGGLRRGTTVELIGRRSSGRFSLVVATLAAVTSTGESAALIDLGDGLDPRAAHQAGMALDRLLWTRPRTVREALACAETILASGMPMLAIELGLPPLVGGRGNEAAWLRLARAARIHESALLIASPYRVSGTAADVVLHAQGRRAAWRPWPHPDAMPCLFHGLDARLDLRKSRGRRPGAHARYAFGSNTAVRVESVPETSTVVSLDAHRSRRRQQRSSLGT